MPTRNDVERTNEQRRLWDLSLNLFHHLNHSNTTIRERTIDEVTTEARRREHQIFTHWCILHDIFLEHQNALRARWIKKSREQRRKILLTAWPNMADSHRPDFKATGLESVEQCGAGTKFRKEFFFPYLLKSQKSSTLPFREDMRYPTSLRVMIIWRHQWVKDLLAYSHAMSTTIPCTSRECCTQMVMEYIANGTTLRLGSRTTILPVDVGWQPGDALVILEIQERVMEFLGQVCLVDIA